MNKYKKLSMIKNKEGDYYDFFKIYMFGNKKLKRYKELMYCYEYKETISLDKFLERYRNPLYDRWIMIGDCKFWRLFIEKNAVILFNKKPENIFVKIPSKISPLVLETKRNFFAIAPSSDSCVESELDHKEGFQELTGCKCPKILEKNFDKDGNIIVHRSYKLKIN